MRVSNSKAREYVNKLEEFQGSNTMGKWVSYDEGMTKLYIVYSYGHHFPMYVYDDNEDTWVGNKDRYSQSTSRHQSLLKPSGGVDIWLDTDELKSLVSNKGIVGLTISKAQQ